MGIFDKAIERLATAITKASPTPIPDYMMNQPQGYGNTVGLPREPNLGSVPFAPGVPILPGAINPVRADGRPDPRRYEFQVAQNINITPTRLVPFGTLRSAADQIDILRRCVEVIKQKMIGLEWDIVLGEDAVEKVMAETGEKSNLRAMQIAKDKYNDDINRMRQFWKQPDVSNGLVFADWLNMALEEILVLDAWAVWPQSTVGGEVLGLQILDGSTIKPLIDDRGMRPAPPTAAFQQILYGFPRSEFSAPVETEEADGEFLSDELQYMVRNRRTNTVYGYSPVERALTLADIYLRRQQWLRAEYTDGVLPELLFTSTADFGNNPDLLKAYENVFNDDLAGDTAQRKRARILPTGLEPVQFDGYGEKFKDVLDEYLVNSICGHFGVLPTEIGFAPKTGLGGASFQAGQAESSEVIGVMPLANWTARMLSNLSYVFLGMPRELEFQFAPSGRTDSAGLAAEVDIKRKNGGLTLNEARSREGLPLIEAPEADQPMIVTPSGVFFVTDEGLVPIADPSVAAQEEPVVEEVETPEESGVQDGVQEAESDDDAKKALGALSASNLVFGEITKYDPNQPRDDKGRFGSGSSTSAPASAPADYRMQHQAPSRSDGFGSPAYNIEEMMPNFYEHPEWYVIGKEKYNQESIAAIKSMQNNPDAPVTVYRAVPEGIKEINQGDWVTLSRTYAKQHIESNLNNSGKILSLDVTAKDLWFDGNSINEFGYDPVKAKALAANLLKFDPSQPRDPKGRFGSRLGNLASQAESGFSVRAVDFKTPTRGYMVARPEGGVVLDAPDLESTKQGLKDFMAQNKARFAEDPTLFIGGWKDSNTGKLYLELSDNVASKRIATELGTRRDQVAVWDVVSSREIGTGGTGGANAEPGTSANPDQIYGAGTVIRKGAFGLLRVVGGGAGQSSGSTSGTDFEELNKYPGQPRDDAGRFSTGGAHGASSTGLLARAKEVEPRNTAILSGIAGKHGAEMHNLKYKLKTQQSLARKIKQDAEEKYDGDTEKAASKINDSLRYTMVAETGNYSAMAESVMADLSAEGYQFNNTKNFWQEGSMYKGINVHMTSPEGHRMELQFHTKESSFVKDVQNHKIYMVQRTIPKFTAEWKAMDAKMAENMDKIPTPPGVESIGTMVEKG
jgi:hypothetical protein